MNRQPWIESMIYWANVSVHCGDDYQILFPPSCHLGFDHHKNYWTSFPIGPRKEEVELLPSQRSKYADDISGMMDLSWWRNFTIESRSIFAMDPDNAWLAGYDHKKQCGTAHVSNRHITVGKKFFLWGNFPEAHVWDTVLTDNDGPYLELMVGCWSDNQPDYSWIAPYETRTVKQYWFPVKGIGGVKNVTIDGAVNVDRPAKDKLLVAIHTSDIYSLCGSYAHPTARTNILACAGWLASCGSCEGSCVRSADTYRNAHHIVAVQANLCEIVFYTEFQKSIRRRGNRPTISVVMLYH